MSRHRRLVAALAFIPLQLAILSSQAEASKTFGSRGAATSGASECSIFSDDSQPCDLSDLLSGGFLPPDVAAAVEKGRRPAPDLDVLGDMLDAMSVLRDDYFAHWVGTWPDGIDWTRAVVGTHVSGTIRSLSEELASVRLDADGDDDVADWKLKSNLIDSYFTQLVSYYFGEDDFAIRNEAYDDMLWVVLGWLEAVRFLDTHTDLHYASRSASHAETPNQMTYYGNLWIPAFAHRARIFWDLASKGWDTELCGGGMIWNPRLLPYKNAITNELFIAASISMYLYFPGDDNRSPFSSPSPSLPPVSKPRDPKYLQAAVDGYRWLSRSNMTDERGLYTDGFHISGYRDRGNNNTRCDEREDTVLTYNQGVLLTGLRGLWEATAAPSYLADGHRLIQSVIAATGWDLIADAPLDYDYDDEFSSPTNAEPEPGSSSRPRTRPLPRWHGLGRAGVLEDPCDAAAVCNQDATTFKGIYFHHLEAYCAPLVMPAPDGGAAANSDNSDSDDEKLRAEVREAALNATSRSHDAACASYRGWLAHNARAALGTRDRHGKFGQWWTAGLLEKRVGGGGGWGPGPGQGPWHWPTMADDGVPRDIDEHTSNRTFWKGPYDSDLLVGPGHGSMGDVAGPPVSQEHRPAHPNAYDKATDQQPLAPHNSAEAGKQAGRPLAPIGELRRRDASSNAQAQTDTEAETRPVRGDPNNRGRGRTVETQTGGLALLRAYWKAQQAAARAR